MVGWVHVVVIWLLAVPWSVKAQANLNNRTFQWKFGGNFVASTFSECQTLPIIVEPLNSTTTDVGAAPYYLIAFEAGGIPSLSMIGSDPNNLTWENAHKRDSTLMLIVLDSNGNTGGVTPGVYNVTEGTETNCLPTLSDDMLPPTIASITPNITDRIETCSPWGLTVSGGTKPYQIVLSALSSPIITNVTMGANDDVFTYIDRADPGEQLMASVVDATGRWGVSTGLITPYGSKNTDCVGLVSSSKTTAQIQQEARDRAAELAQERRDHQHLVIGVSVAVPVAAILIISTAIWWFLRRRSQYGVGTWDNSQDSIPRAWHMPPANANVDMRENHADPTQPPYNPLQTSLPDMDVTPLPAVYFDREVEKAQSSSTLVSGTTSAPQTPSAPLTPRERKLLQARGQHPPTVPSRVPYTASRSATSLPFATSAGQIDNNYNPDVQPDIIIQHRDGGAGIVQELPPPYADRSALSSASLSSPSASSLSNPSRFREHTD